MFDIEETGGPLYFIQVCGLHASTFSRLSFTLYSSLSWVDLLCISSLDCILLGTNHL